MGGGNKKMPKKIFMGKNLFEGGKKSRLYGTGIFTTNNFVTMKSVICGT